MSNPELVDLTRLRELIADLKLDDPKFNEYIDARWIKYIEWWDSRSEKNKRMYHLYRGAVVVGGALIPALVGLRELNVWGNYSWAFAVASIVVSLVVAISGGLEALYNPGGIWREKRAAAELIKSEGFSFLQLDGEYERFESHNEAFKLFAGNVERLIRSEIKDYIVAASPKNINDDQRDNRAT